MLNRDAIYEDISAFADDPNEVVLGLDGTVIFVRNGKDLTFKVFEDEEGRTLVEYEGSIKTYKHFISFDIAKLNILAERIVNKRTSDPLFVNSVGKRDSVSLERKTDLSLDLLKEECEKTSAFATRVVFITADAGHGKTLLLREFQHQNAKKFLAGQVPYLFWHVDLQGRQLLRLHEALMGDLGELRFSGIWMPGIVRLLRHKLLVLAIDGFDELAAEQGRTDALGALSLLVQQLSDNGVVVAASRRTFFDTEDYVKKSGMVQRRLAGNCDFDQIHLLGWTETECMNYLNLVTVEGRRFTEPKKIYADILLALNNNIEHPMVKRPFLFTHIAKGILLYEVPPSEFVTGVANGFQSVARVVRAFIEREVAHKWRERETGRPYLTIDQHMQLLSNVALEMWTNEVDRLDIDVIETLAMILFDEWQIPEDKRRQIIEMLKMHVLLVRPNDGDERARSFDHPEFKDYFISLAIKDSVIAGISGKTQELQHTLSLAQLPDSSANYLAITLDRDNAFIEKFVKMAQDIVSQEWKPTYLQNNIGTLIPSIINGYSGNRLDIDCKVIYSSLVFENINFENTTIRNGKFLKVSFNGNHFKNCTFDSCEFIDLAIDRECVFTSVKMDSCNFQGIRVFEGEEEVWSGYSPERIGQILTQLGIEIVESEQGSSMCPVSDGPHRRLATKVLRIFRHTTAISGNLIELKFPKDEIYTVNEFIFPTMAEFGIVWEKDWRGRGKPQSLWTLCANIDDVLRADCGEGQRDFVAFWAKVDSYDTAPQYSGESNLQ